MPRAPVAGKEIRRRSRNGCWNCKARKVKCGEEKPRCSNCERLDEDCDYKIRLSWGGRPLKKKLLENGGSGQDANADDPSQFIPGAGQFPLNQHFPSPQTFVQATPSNGTRRPPIPRVSNGKRTSMSVFQNVFSVAEPSGVSPPAMPPPSAPVDPRLSAPVTRPHPPQRPPPIQSTISVQHQNQNQSKPYVWQPDLTPTTPTPPTTSFESDSPFKTEPQQQPIFSGYTPSSSYGYQDGGHLHSPTTGPPSMVTSPTTPYGGPHGSPSLRYPQPKAYHSPPPIVASPTKRPRTSSTSPDINYLGSSSSALQPLMSLSRALDYSPLVPIPNHMARVDALRVENLLLPSLSDDGSYIDPHAFKGQDTQDSNELYVVGQGEPVPYDDDDSEIEMVDRDGPGNYDDGSNSMMMLMSAMSRGGYSNNDGNFYQFYPTIPRKLDPLPGLLRDDRKNMMYFDHYVKHTARLLVPHDCSENPFKSILPQMAVQTDHLMNLLLAYSASHRARLLDHPEPTERIGQFLDETVRSLHSSLDDPVGAKSDSTLATAIMLSSYQIISPNPFSIGGLTWQTHLSAARKIILSRGGAEGMHSRDKVSYFLVRWFAYLDLLGSLSGRDTEEPVFSGKYWTNDNGEDEAEEYSVDCFFGFTSRCVSILAKIGALARRVEVLKREYVEALEREFVEAQEYAEQSERGLIISRGGMAEGCFSESDWVPNQAIFEEARALQVELEDARGKAVGSCTHTHHREEEHSDPRDNIELLATNDSFHWAALIHLYRRVLNYPPKNNLVQTSVAQIVSAMAKVRRGGTAENCLLFPLFSAGCEALAPYHREYTRQRMIEVERSGLVQVRHARILMERVWAEHKPWWEIASGEFIG